MSESKDKTIKKRSKIENFKGKQVKFSKTNQPKPKAKSLGWDKKRKGQELVRAILALKFKGKKDSEISKQVAEMFNVPVGSLTVEMMGNFRQAEKMITQADTLAYKALREAAGLTNKTEIELSGSIETSDRDKAALRALDDDQLLRMLEIVNEKK